MASIGECVEGLGAVEGDELDVDEDAQETSCFVIRLHHMLWCVVHGQADGLQQVQVHGQAGLPVTLRVVYALEAFGCALFKVCPMASFVELECLKEVVAAPLS